MRHFLGITTVLIIAFSSCEREHFINDMNAGIEFSMDTLYFDTVFTELSTVTKRFTIHNPHKDYVKISSLQLAGGSSSVFRINLDGNPGVSFKDIEIPPEDSIYVFVEATLDPNNSNDILLQQDSIVTETNGKMQDINIVAWGQDVHMIRRGLINTQTWINDKPYLILDYAIVDSLQTLTLEPGVRIYMHRNAIMYIGGTLISKGTRDQPVQIRGDRLESFYEDIPGQWGGLYFYAGTRDNQMNYTEITAGNFGIIVDTFMNDNPTLDIRNSTIAHMSSVGILAQGARVRGVNNLIYNTGSSNLALTIGGEYEFFHCTFANRWAFDPPRRDPAIFISNYYLYNDTLSSGIVVQKPEIRDIERAYFGNCIIYGSLSNELLIDKYEGMGVLNHSFENCLGRFIPEEVPMDTLNFPNLINNKDPMFIDWENYDFRLDSLSPAINAGSIEAVSFFNEDFDGVDRLQDGKPDIGAFEWVPESDDN